MKTCLAAALLSMINVVADAVPVTYAIDPHHTFPSFEADHRGGMSVWRGKFRESSGTVVLDAAAHSGSVDILIQTASIDFGLETMNTHAKAAEIFDVEKYPTARYKGTFSKFNGDVPAAVSGELTLHGVTRPLSLTVNSFKCSPNPMTKKDTCGADASAVFNRDDFGIDYGKGALGFNMQVKLAIQVEAIKAD